MSSTISLKFRVPEESPAPSIQELVTRAWPEGTPEEVHALFADHKVKIEHALALKPAFVPFPETIIYVDSIQGDAVYGLPDATDLARGEDWIIVDKPVGMPGKISDDHDPMDPVRFLADMLGLDRDTFTPVWNMPANAGGPWMFGLTEEAARTHRTAFLSGKAMMTWTAIVARPLMPSGRWTGPANVPIDYTTIIAQGGLAEVQLNIQFTPNTKIPNDQIASFILDTLAACNTPVVGDRKRGGYQVTGGLRLRVSALYQEDTDLAYSWSSPSDWWPEQPVAPTPEVFQKAKEAAVAHEIPTLTVSPKTIEVIARQGHPWVLEDAQTSGRAHLVPGTLVQLAAPNSAIKSNIFALTEGPGELAARVWSTTREEAEDFDEEIDMRVDEAVALRADFLRDSNRTNLFRLIHAEADGLPGFWLDRMGSVLRATLTGDASDAFKDRIYSNFVAHDPDMMIIEVPHLRDIREGDKLPTATIIHHGTGYLKPGEHTIALEDGLKYRCEPWEGIDVGFFADQRENRRTLTKLVKRSKEQQNWLNLFCHTGAFTVALADRGAHVTSVDLSRRYLKWLEENLALNDIPQDLNTSIAADCRDYLKDCTETFDGIIVDPPTAAAGTSAFWSVRKDYQKLLTQCFQHLAPNGVMLVCRNDRKRTPTLESVVRAAAEQAGYTIDRIEPAPPAPDYPNLRGFPEGDTFEGLLVYGKPSTDS